MTMQEGSNRGKESSQPNGAEEDTQPQKGGEAATTRFGMEDGRGSQDHASDQSDAKSAEDSLAAESRAAKSQRKADEVAEELGDFA
jgi:hypothetical protein